MVPISPQAYSAEAVVFDTRPLAVLQQKLAAKKAAKDEALDKYFLDLKNKINPAGMRTQDLPEWNNELAGWISNGVMNRKEIAKGGLAQQEHLLKYQDLLSKVEQSKQMGKFQSDLESKKQEGKIDEDDFPLLDSIRLSIYNRQHYKNPETLTPYSMGDFSENIPTWDVGKRKQFIDFAISGVKPAGKANEYTVYDEPSFTDITTYDEVFTPKQIQDVSQKAIAVLSDKSGLKTYKQILKEGEQQVPSDQFINLAKAYELVNPTDVMDTPLKVAQADVALSMIGVKEAKTIPRINRQKLEGYKSGLIEGRKKEGEESDEGFIDYWAEIVEKSKTPSIVGNVSDPKKQVQGIPLNSLTATPQKRIIDIANSIAGEKFSQSDLILQKMPDGSIHILKVLYGGKGKDIAYPTGVEDIVAINPEDVNLKPQIDVKSRRIAAEKAKQEKGSKQLKGIPKDGF